MNDAAAPGRRAADGRNLRIGFDAIRAFRNRTGLGNYARGVLRALHQLDPTLDLHLYSPWGPRREYAGLADELRAHVHVPAAGLAGRPAGSLWREFRAGRAARRDGVQLYHGLTHVMPRDLPGTGIPAVVTFHDLIVEELPTLFRRFDRWSYRRRFRWSARHADAIVAVSHATRQALIDRYHVDPDRISVIPPPRDVRFAASPSAAALDAVRQKYRLPPRYLLSVGTLEARKNQQVLLDALARPGAGASLPLVLVGRDGGRAVMLRRAAQELGIADRVWIETGVDAADLPAVMHGAAVFLYPSLMEGFGMPIVEALSAGVPVVAASGGHLDDAAGPGSWYASPQDPAAWAEAIARLLGDDGAAARLRAAGVAHAATFDPGRVAEALLDLYDQVVTIRPGRAEW